jgi:hypothetical protein
MRWALAVVRRQAELPGEVAEEADYLADDPTEPVELATLDAIAGGNYWREVALDPAVPFAQKIERFTEQYLERLVESFTYAAAYEVKEKYEHRVPKYVLVYGTRHPDGLGLMNDGMCKARLEFLGRQFKQNVLFDCTPEGEAPDTEGLRRDLLEILGRGRAMSRKELRVEALQRHFGKFLTKDINAAVGELLRSGKLFSNTGKTRINDDVVLSAAPLTPQPSQAGR